LALFAHQNAGRGAGERRTFGPTERLSPTVDWILEVIPVAGSATDVRPLVPHDLERRSTTLPHWRSGDAVLVAVFVGLGVFVGRDGSWAWQFTRLLGVTVLAVLAIGGGRHMSDRGRGWIAIVVGTVGIAVGAGFVPYVVKETASLTALAATVAMLGGLVLVTTGAMRRTRGRRRVRRGASTLGGLVAVALVTYVVGPAVAATNVPRPAIGASGSDRLLRAVVAEGATARTATDEGWLSDEHGVRGAFSEQLERVQDWVTDALTSASVPTALRTAVGRSGDTAYLLITAGKVADEGHAAAYIAGAAPDRVQTWTVDRAGHTDGLKVAPDEWERRLTSFLTTALGVGVRGR
jgi:hypothetical protein